MKSLKSEHRKTFDRNLWVLFFKKPVDEFEYDKVYFESRNLFFSDSDFHHIYDFIEITVIFSRKAGLSGSLIKYYNYHLQRRCQLIALSMMY